MANADIGIKFDINSLGPHTNLKFDDKTSSIKIGIFANNGIGKTFISRAFRLASPMGDFTSQDTNNILKTNENKGKFIFETVYQDNPSKQLEIILNKDSEPIIQNNTDYLFHVFNSDYVADNLEYYGYRPLDDIEGYILGKSNIDVKKEEIKLEELIEELEKLHNKIKITIENAIEDLDALEINKNIKNYRAIKFENVMKGIDLKEEESFESLKNMRQNLESMPEDIRDIPILEYSIKNSVLVDIEDFLLTIFDKSNLNGEFVDRVKSEQDFIEKGIELYDLDNDNKCPFCKQKLNEKAFKIIDFYIQYIQDKEAKIIKKIDVKIKNLKKFKSNIEEHNNRFNKINTQFNSVKKYLPSYSDTELKSLDDNEIILDTIDEIIKMFEIKREDITFTKFDLKNQIIKIKNFLEKLKRNFDSQNEKISLLNDKKNSIKDERLQLNKRLCDSRAKDILKEQKINIKKSKNVDSKIKVLKNEIKEKENKSKINKKRKVVESLKYFLNFFFDGKYDFNSEEFCITFNDEILSNNAKHVLSDGEKGIVAFCYYLAITHTIIEKEDDYKNLFFIIDDPISSMDFNFVYAVARSIEEIKGHFNTGRYVRFILFTHNLEFMNCLMRNGIINQKYILEKGNMNKWNKQLMLPYDNHLLDILKISKGEKNPSHTTPNSIRHILESICKFEHRDKKLEKYVSENPKLKDDGYIYYLMQDLSHGNLRYQPPIAEGDIKKACNVVINHILERYPGQIEGLI